MKHRTSNPARDQSNPDLRGQLAAFKRLAVHPPKAEPTKPIRVAVRKKKG